MNPRYLFSAVLALGGVVFFWNSWHEYSQFHATTPAQSDVHAIFKRLELADRQSSHLWETLPALVDQMQLQSTRTERLAHHLEIVQNRMLDWERNTTNSKDPTTPSPEARGRTEIESRWASLSHGLVLLIPLTLACVVYRGPIANRKIQLLTEDECSQLLNNHAELGVKAQNLFRKWTTVPQTAEQLDHFLRTTRLNAMCLYDLLMHLAPNRGNGLQGTDADYQAIVHRLQWTIRDLNVSLTTT